MFFSKGRGWKIQKENGYVRGRQSKNLAGKRHK